MTSMRYGTSIVLQDVSIPGVKAGQNTMGGNCRSIDVPMTSMRYGTVNPATNGELIKCEYWLECECSIPWAPDISVELPVTIYAPQNSNYQFYAQPPAGWNASSAMSYDTVNLQFSSQYNVAALSQY